MKLKPVMRRLGEDQYQTPEREGGGRPEKGAEKGRRRGDGTLPPDEYQPMFPPRRMLCREFPSKRDPSKRVRQYIEVSVKRFNDDAAMPFVWVSMYQESEQYTGYLKGKSACFPLEMLYDFRELLDEVDEECDRRHITT